MTWTRIFGLCEGLQVMMERFSAPLLFWSRFCLLQARFRMSDGADQKVGSAGRAKYCSKLVSPL